MNENARQLAADMRTRAITRRLDRLITMVARLKPKARAARPRRKLISLL